MLIHRIKGIFLLKLAKISCDFFSYGICNCYKANDGTNHFRIVINNRSAGKKRNENFLILPRVSCVTVTLTALKFPQTVIALA